jgi:hypothetical protein
MRDRGKQSSTRRVRSLDSHRTLDVASAISFQHVSTPAVQPQNPRSRMSKPTERSHEQKPFDSRRTKRVTLVTPRNPVPTAVAPSSAPTEKDDPGQVDRR